MVILLKEVFPLHTNLSKIHLNFGLQRENYDGKYRQFRVFRFDPKDFLAHFWQNFLLTLAGAIGLISMVAVGPEWITYPSLILTIILLVLVGRSLKRTEN